LYELLNRVSRRWRCWRRAIPPCLDADRGFQVRSAPGALMLLGGGDYLQLSEQQQDPRRRPCFAISAAKTYDISLFSRSGSAACSKVI